MKIITSFKIAGLITACLFAAMPTKADKIGRAHV